jgi:alpha-L-arabinofuranosidase
MCAAIVTITGNNGPIAPATLLGHNLELFADTTRHLQTDRLDNPKFAGPADWQTGIAREWRSPNSNFMGISYQLVPGEGILGSDAQMLETTGNRANKGLIQPNRWIRQGERLRVTLWARTVHAPATVHVGLRPSSVWSEPYCTATFTITSACWQEYTAVLVAPCDDDAASFYVFLDEPGKVFLDQVHLRPDGAGVIREDLLQVLGDFHIPVLRFPGGCLTTCYHWQFGTGPHERRPVLPDPVFKREMNYEFGTDEYLAFCTRFGIIPQLTVNIGTGTPDEAAEWAAYCADWYRTNGLEPPLIYWQLGNEHYGHWERSHMTGAMYADVIRALAPGIKAAYPQARIAALGQEWADELNQARQPWRAPVLDGAGDLIDLLVLQIYTILPPNPDAEAQHRRVFREATHAAKLLTAAVRDVQARGLGTRIGLSEWNLWTQASHFAPQGFVEPMDIQHGLFIAVMLHHYARLAPVMELANFYHIIAGMGVFQVERDCIRATHVADVFRLYRPAFPGAVLPLAVTPTADLADLDGVDGLALAGENDRWLFLLNKHPREAAVVTLVGIDSPTEIVILAGDDPLAETAHRQLPVYTDNKLSLPPLSITRVRW